MVSSERGTGAVGTRPPQPADLEGSERRELEGEELRQGIRSVLDDYLAELIGEGGLSAVGGVERVVEAVRRVLPRPNRLAVRAGPVYTTRQLQVLLPGVEAEAITDQAVRNRLESGQLVGAKTRDDRWVYPAFQFRVGPGHLQIRRDVVELWRELPWDGPMDRWTLIAWLTGPREDLDGDTPLMWLERHGLDEPLRVAAGRLRRRAA